MIGKNTPEKQKDLKAILTVLICAGNRILDKYEKNNWEADSSLWIYDLNAGPGIHDDNSIGSPLILLDLLIKYTKRECKLILFENDHDKKGNFINLCNNLNKIKIPGRIELHTIKADHRERLSSLYEGSEKKRFGLCYQDYSGTPNFDVLSKFSHKSCNSKTDILINCNTTQIKRNRGLSRNDKYTVSEETRDPMEAIQDIDKQYWQIREPLGKWQWQMLLGTNWPALPNFRKLGFEEYEK